MESLETHNKIKEILENLLKECKTWKDFEYRCRLMFPVELIRILWQPANAPNVRFVEMVYDVNKKPVKVSVNV